MDEPERRLVEPHHRRNVDLQRRDPHRALAALARPLQRQSAGHRPLRRLDPHAGDDDRQSDDERNVAPRDRGRGRQREHDQDLRQRHAAGDQRQREPPGNELPGHDLGGRCAGVSGGRTVGLLRRKARRDPPARRRRENPVCP
jgi:hypothetical protein